MQRGLTMYHEAAGSEENSSDPNQMETTTMAYTQDNVKNMNREMRHIMEHAEALVEATAGELDNRIASARTALKDRLDLAKNEYGDLEVKLMEKVQSADEFVHLKPYYVIGGTFISGLLLGWMMTRK
jgi:ElaB/YqjD/DUF883 family membrane-anchored ribosome-binding protein